MKYIKNRFLRDPLTGRPRVGLLVTILCLVVCGALIAEGGSRSTHYNPDAIDFEVTTDPTGAHIKINGAPMGQTPWKGTLKEGAHWVEVTKEGFLTVTREVRLPFTQETDTPGVLNLGMRENEKKLSVISSFSLMHERLCEFEGHSIKPEISQLFLNMPSAKLICLFDKKILRQLTTCDGLFIFSPQV